MTKSSNVKQRILSLLLTFALVISVMPTKSMTANAATPSEARVIEVESKNFVTYSNNVVAYYKCENYLYKVVFSNMKNTSGVRIHRTGNLSTASIGLLQSKIK